MHSARHRRRPGLGATTCLCSVLPLHPSPSTDAPAPARPAASPRPALWAPQPGSRCPLQLLCAALQWMLETRSFPGLFSALSLPLLPASLCNLGHLGHVELPVSSLDSQPHFRGCRGDFGDLPLLQGLPRCLWRLLLCSSGAAMSLGSRSPGQATPPPATALVLFHFLSAPHRGAWAGLGSRQAPKPPLAGSTMCFLGSALVSGTSRASSQIFEMASPLQRESTRGRALCKPWLATSSSPLLSSLQGGP